MSLRSCLARLEKQGELVRVRREVDRRFELSAVAKKLDGGPAVLFENVRGFSMPVLVGTEGTKDRVAGNLGVKTGINIDFHNLLGAATGNPVMALLMAALMDILREFVGEVGSVMGIDVIHSRRRLLRHMKARDADKAVAEMERHLKVLHGHYLTAAARLKRRRVRGKAKERQA